MASKFEKDSLKIRRHFLDNNYDNQYLLRHYEIINPEQSLKGSTVLSYWKKYVNKKKKPPIDFYINIPYCVSRCDYCVFTTRPINIIELENYVDKLICYLSNFEAVFQGTVFRNLYLGGGTPSVLSEANLDKLLGFVQKHFKFEKDGGKCCEMDPITASKSKIAILKKYHFNRISFGAQSLNSEVIKINNRGLQTNKMVEDTFTRAREVGIKYINVDLILGLFGDTKTSFLDSLRKMFILRPNSICLYFLQGTGNYVNKHFKGKIENFNKHFLNFSKNLMSEVASMAIEFEYMISDNTERILVNRSEGSAIGITDLRVEDIKKLTLLIHPM